MSDITHELTALARAEAAEAKVAELEKQLDDVCDVLYNTGATRGDALTRAKRAKETYNQLIDESVEKDEECQRLRGQLGRVRAMLPVLSRHLPRDGHTIAVDMVKALGETAADTAEAKPPEFHVQTPPFPQVAQTSATPEHVPLLCVPHRKQSCYDCWLEAAALTPSESEKLPEPHIQTLPVPQVPVKPERCKYCNRVGCESERYRDDSRLLRMCRHAVQLERDFLRNRVSRLEGVLERKELERAAKERP